MKKNMSALIKNTIAISVISVFGFTLSCGRESRKSVENNPEQSQFAVSGNASPTTFSVQVYGTVSNKSGKVEGALVKSRLYRCSNRTTGRASSTTDQNGTYDQMITSTRCRRTRPKLIVCATKGDESGCVSKRVQNGDRLEMNVKIEPPPPPPVCNSCVYQLQCPGPYHCLNGCCEFIYTNYCYYDLQCWPGQCVNFVCTGL